ncbi:MAG: DUF1553 domain-containing protein, partial [Gemmataceae bacterium]
PVRHDAEVLRDAMLTVSGQLDRKAPVGSPIATAGEGYAAQRLRQAGLFGQKEDETHRSVYLPIVRENLPEVLELFDAADPNLVSGVRDSTTVATQALYLLNNPFVLKQAEATSIRLYNMGNSDPERVRQAYRVIYGRSPSAEELQNAESFLAKLASQKTSKKQSWGLFCQALLMSAEFLVRN